MAWDPARLPRFQSRKTMSVYYDHQVGPEQDGKYHCCCDLYYSQEKEVEGLEILQAVELQHQEAVDPDHAHQQEWVEPHAHGRLREEEEEDEQHHFDYSVS